MQNNKQNKREQKNPEQPIRNNICQGSDFYKYQAYDFYK